MTRSSRIALVAASLFICALFVTLVALSTQRGTRRLQASNPKLETSGIASTSAVPAPHARGERPTRARASHLQQTTQTPWLWLSPDSSLAHDVWTYTGTRNAESAEGIDGRTAARNLSTSQPNHREPSLSVASDEQDEGGHREVAPARDDATPRSTEPERGTGSLTVIAATPGELLIDGVTYGERSALVVPRLPVGRHRVELRSGGSTSVREVDIRRGHRRMLRLAFDEAESATSSDALTQNP